MSDYKATILGKYPKIVDATVSISRWGKDIKPFNGWDTGKLAWWGAYQNIKHNRGANFENATYLNSVYALSALYISILYLAKATNIDIDSGNSQYIYSRYTSQIFCCALDKELPDFE